MLIRGATGTNFLSLRSTVQLESSRDHGADGDAEQLALKSSAPTEPAEDQTDDGSISFDDLSTLSWASLPMSSGGQRRRRSWN